MYKGGKQKVDLAIKEYDQAVFDFTSQISTNTALVVSDISISIEGKALFSFWLMNKHCN